MCAERAWALGMELKQAANTEHRKRFHLMRRLQRTFKHASELIQLCEGSERCDARTRLEAQVSVFDELATLAGGIFLSTHTHTHTCRPKHSTVCDKVRIDCQLEVFVSIWSRDI